MLQLAAAAFCRRLTMQPGCTCVQRPLSSNTPADVVWENTLLRSPTFRRAHVETFMKPDKVGVLHVCVFPHWDDPAPIFGFDLVAGPARITGIFLDLSPVLPSRPQLTLRDAVGSAALQAFATRRALPEWADIFSEDMVAIRPVSGEEIDRALALAEQALDVLLATVRVTTGQVVDAIAAGQARYCAGQRQNEHTVRMLTNFIGLEEARRFVDQVLFPIEWERDPGSLSGRSSSGCMASRIPASTP